MFKAAIIATALVTAPPAFADLVTKPSASPVDLTMDALVNAVEGAGATVFARVDHTAGAETAGMFMADAELLIFGNPKLGTPAMQDDIRAGLFLPLRVLVYADAAGATQVAYEHAADLFDGLEIAADADYVAKIEQALSTLTDKAVAN